MADRLSRFFQILDYARRAQAPTRREELALQQASAQSARLFEQDKYIVGKYTSLWQGSTSPAERETIKTNLQNYFNTLEPARQDLVKPFLNLGPIDPSVERLATWEKRNPRPPFAGAAIENDRVFADLVLKEEDWKRRRTTFMTGKDPGATDLVFLPEDKVAIRDAGGVPQVVSYDKLDLAAFAKENNTTPGKIIADRGRHYTSTRTGRINGQEVEIRNYVGLLDPTGGYDMRNLGYGEEKIPTGKPTPQQAEEQRRFTDFLAAFASAGVEFETGDPKPPANRYFLGFQELRDAGVPLEVIYEGYLKQIFPSKRLRVVNKKTMQKRGWYSAIRRFSDNDYFESEAEFIVDIPGVPFFSSYGKDPGEWGEYFFEQSSGQLFNSVGMLIEDETTKKGIFEALETQQ